MSRRTHTTRAGCFGAALGLLGALSLGAATNPESQRLAQRVASAEVSYDRASLQLAIDQLTTLTAQNPQNPEYFYYLARVYFPLIDLYDWVGDRDLASEAGHKGMEYLETSIKLGGDTNPDAYRLLGDYYGRLSFFQGAFGRLRYAGRSAKYHKIAFEKAPADPRAVIGYATDKLSAPSVFGGDVVAAVELFKKAIAIDPGTAVGYVWLAKAYLKQGETALARAEFDKARKLAPKSGFVQGEWEAATRQHDELKTAKTASAS